MRESRVLPKLVVLVLIAAGTAATLLAIRQRRVEAAHDLARIQADIADHDKSIWRLRLEIATRVRPSEVRAMSESMGPLTPIYSDDSAVDRPTVPVRNIAASSGAAAPRAGGVAQ